MAGSLRVTCGDALEVDLAALTDGRSAVLVANLPYNVATTIFLQILETAPMIKRGLVMVQREVADRLTAQPGEKAFGIPTLRLNAVADVEKKGAVPPDVFFPRPRVMSALVAFRRLEMPRVDPRDPDLLWRLVREAFGQRRKMLRSTLRRYGPELFERSGVDGRARPEQLTLEDWARLAEQAEPS